MALTLRGLINKPRCHVSTMVLLSDGRLMAQAEGTAHWHALTPDRYGNYLNGSGSAPADVAFERYYSTSGLFDDGQAIVIDDEKRGTEGSDTCDQIYRKAQHKRNPPLAPATSLQADSAVRTTSSDPTLTIGAVLWDDCTVCTPSTSHLLRWESRHVRTNAKTWVMLPDQTVLTLDGCPAFPTPGDILSSETAKYQAAVSSIVADDVINEIGPAILMSNGQVIFCSAADGAGYRKTWIYTPPPHPDGTGAWGAGPEITMCAAEAHDESERDA